jgi:hypothetical protein
MYHSPSAPAVGTDEGNYRLNYMFPMQNYHLLLKKTKLARGKKLKADTPAFIK